MGFFDTPLRLISVKQKENDLLWQDLSAQEKYHAEKRNDELNTKGKRPGYNDAMTEAYTLSSFVQVIEPDQVQAIILRNDDGEQIEIPIR